MDFIKKMAEHIGQLPEEEIRAILAKQREERLKRGPVKISELDNEGISKLPEFVEYCNEKGIEPTKRQAGKRKSEFAEWLREKGSERV